VCIGRGGVVAAQCRRSTAATRGSFFFSSVECTHRPLLRDYHHGHVFRVASLLCAFFPRAMLCARAATGGLGCVHGREAKVHDTRRGV